MHIIYGQQNIVSLYISIYLMTNIEEPSSVSGQVRSLIKFV